MTGWTVLLYLAGHDELEPYMARTLACLEEHGPPPGINVVVQLARAPFALLEHVLPCRLPTEIDGDWSGVRRYRLRARPPGGSASRFYSEQLADLGPANMADPGTLADFLAFGRTAFPASRYALAVSAHGLGFPGLIYDLAAGPHPWHMTIRGLRTAVRAARVPLEMLVLDACSMNSVEAICELAGRREVAKWLIVPAGPSPRQGLDYPAILPLFHDSDPSLPARVAETLERSFGEQVLALRLDPARWSAAALAARKTPGSGLPVETFQIAASTCTYPPQGRNARFLIWPDPAALPELFHAVYRPLQFCRLSRWNRLLSTSPPGPGERSRAGMVKVTRHLLRNWGWLLRPELSSDRLELLLDSLGSG